jgi:hypothetical protein
VLRCWTLLCDFQHVTLTLFFSRRLLHGASKKVTLILQVMGQVGEEVTLILELVICHAFCYQHLTYCIIYNICKGILPHDLFFLGVKTPIAHRCICVILYRFRNFWRNPFSYLPSTMGMCFQLMSHSCSQLIMKRSAGRHLVVLQSPQTKTQYLHKKVSFFCGFSL